MLKTKQRQTKNDVFIGTFETDDSGKEQAKNTNDFFLTNCFIKIFSFQTLKEKHSKTYSFDNLIDDFLCPFTSISKSFMLNREAVRFS